MKKLLFIALIAFSINATAQITLEHSYDTASTCPDGGLSNQLMIVKFEVSGERYVKINNITYTICIYDMNHSLQKTISFAGFPCGNNSNILCLSENLFNLDSKIEFMYSGPTGPTTVYTGIYNEDGTLIFSEPGAPIVKINTPLQQFPIYNTLVGTKMILSYPSGVAKVFSLPGTLSEDIEKANNYLLSQNSVSNPYPNPAINSTQIDYAFPKGTNQGEIVFYNLQGKEIKRFKVDNTFSSLLISTSDLAAGTYYYQLQTTGQSSAGKKMIVIK